MINFGIKKEKMPLVIIGGAIIIVLVIVAFSILKPKPPIGPPPEISPPPEGISPPPKELSPEARELQEKAIANPQIVTGPEGSKLILYEPKGEPWERDFDVSYIQPSELFIIFVYNDNPEDFEPLKKQAEEFFVKELLKTDDIKAVCELNVVVQGYKYSTENPNVIDGVIEKGLSFCES